MTPEQTRDAREEMRILRDQTQNTRQMVLCLRRALELSNKINTHPTASQHNGSPIPVAHKHEVIDLSTGVPEVPGTLHQDKDGTTEFWQLGVYGLIAAALDIVDDKDAHDYFAETNEWPEFRVEKAQGFDDPEFPDNFRWD